ncbi:hypothetical protein MP478_06145 [Chryseobacterium sp. WG14]|uniref:hypothetical protein n=1 Tax=Chryseobacterium sp. WG14 TaxID=2926909 RepID=UPI00211EF2A5|nr:hypothetical protein [Chryseobacterium sp. WG14]MCQ9638967.1 hypothetical protein [Chryseobacterium sp. WG14]
MKKQIKKEKKLSLEKLQLVKINNPKRIFGGTKQVIDGCNNPDNGSGNDQGGVGGGGY